MTSLTWLGHATVLLDIGGVRVLTDPVLRGRVAFLRRVVPPVPHGACAGADLVLISHLHHDHCDLPSLRSLGPDPQIVAPPGGGDFLRERGFRRVITLRPGESHTAGPVRVTATPAVHDGTRRPFGPRAAAVGYLVAAADTAVYFAGDTALFDGMRKLCHRLDMALVPVWGWGPNLGAGHLDPRSAAEAVARLRPRLAVPVHWGTLFPYGLSPFFGHRLRTPGHDFADAVRARGLGTDVRVLAPGGVMAWRL
ncbi:MBL fold metallo-hydrolase [Actinomadura sp. 3N508]|uniref:MBL fold metallo-hydrolase n=1 Tax=Actinomadura sp. 3N508 TaxID=3375153 RepID=UPI0037998F5C